LKPSAALALVIFATIVSAKLSTYGHGWMMGDFKTFYCAAKVAAARENPYDAGPLGACERRPVPKPLYLPKPGLVLPAPLPGYAIAAFMPFAALPFTGAVLLWFVFLTAATIGAVLLLARMGAGDVWTVSVAFAVALVAISFVLGQVVPIAVFGVTLSAFAASQKPSALASFMMAAGMMLVFAEPQAGIAVAIVGALLGRRFVLPIAAGLACLAALSLWAVGVRENVLYLRDVLPSQLLAELPVYFQYSASWIAAHLGMSASHAVAFGRLQWIAMLALAAGFARSHFAREHAEIAFLAAPAFAVVGGPYLHLQHVALALPAALWLASASHGASRLASVAVAALALPLLQFFLIAARTPIAVDLVMYLAMAAWLGLAYGGSARWALVTCAATAGAIVIVAAAFAVTGFGLVSVAPAQVVASQIPQVSWAHFAAAHYAAASPAVWLVKMPTWFALGATGVSLITAAWGYRRRKQLSGATTYAT
jgi:hypothetical protein